MKLPPYLVAWILTSMAVIFLVFLWLPGQQFSAAAGATDGSGAVSNAALGARPSGQAHISHAAHSPSSANQPTYAGAAAVRLRGQEEDSEMRVQHETALRQLGLPPVTAPKPRRPLAKEPLRQPPGEAHQILVKFHDRFLARAGSDGSLILSAEQIDQKLLKVVQEHGLRFLPNHTAGEEGLTRLEAEALAATKEQPADLGGMLLVATAQPGKDAIWAAANALQSLGVTEFVTLSSLDQPPPPPLPYDIAPPTELLSGAQTYRGEAGINIDEAWRLHDAKGAGVRVTDCEYSYNPNHEDLTGLVEPQPGVDSYYNGFGDDHGTAVLGILVAGDNSYGMTGMVPLASAYFYPEFAQVNGRYQYRSAAIAAALAASQRGDVVLLEMQATGADGDYGPAEYEQDVWLVVKTGTDAGKHVVAAAGNGSQNLDSPGHQAYRDRGDSGAIIVGAASEARERLSYSTYGTRVNLQGWGAWNVATLGVGDYWTYADDHNQKYTRGFSGTSSASPIVTAAVVAVESMARTSLGRSLTPREMRQLLVQTGQPQTGNLTENIGPLPDVPAALAEILPLPRISSLMPDKGQEGTVVTITGERFDGVSAVTFDGVDASFSVIDATTLTAVVPPQARTGKVFVTASGGIGRSESDFRLVAGPAEPVVSIEPVSWQVFSTQQGEPSDAQAFTIAGHSLIGGLSVVAPPGYEVSLDGLIFSNSVEIPASAAADSAANYGGGWMTGSNGGLGFKPWSIQVVQSASSYAGVFLGDAAVAGITGFGATAFGLYANPAGSGAVARADRPLAGPLRIGETLRFEWAVNWDSGGTGVKGFAVFTGGPGMTELFRVEQGDFPGSIYFTSASGVPSDTGISYGTAPMTWSVTRTGEEGVTLTATGRDGSDAVVFERSIEVVGAPDAFRWYAAGLNSSGAPAENDRRQPYFDNLHIVPASIGGGVLGSTLVYVRLSEDALAGPVAGLVTFSSEGAVGGAIFADGIVSEAPASDYVVWVQGYGLDPQTTGATAADPDGDGWSNVVEFAYGTSPRDKNATLVSVWQDQESGFFVMKWLQRKTGILYSLKHTDDMSAALWKEPLVAGPVLANDQSMAPQGYEFFEFAVQVSGSSFYRVEAILE